ncbi:two-component system, sensor histidine kinase RegB [Cohaesibacter sp. ES.047]|uniref:ActS/PrrB/RegB family redox-sensitive histidine kinase n=1 Tax=Cohaesibacter sp. ES.047 TaxID=1798205 RepID=UPI000BB96BB5|nr:ActS/PrrB/RegB family redox-sensitive histidine kinase [Cohaesibacter sp. ES.047]SNY90131.1 two-component system, sensor histidine kinase RegB [Cohaesibacter sp. ES.047]
MDFSPLPTSEFATLQIKLDTLVRLRWLAILGQAIAVVLVWLGLGYDFDAVLCLALVGLSAGLNLYLQAKFRKSVRLSPLPATGLLAYDTAQLGGLLYLTGGLQNPFSLLLLVPAVVSATMQPPRYTVFLACLITIIATALVIFHQPLPWVGHRPPTMPVLYMAGIWIALILTMGFMSIYTFRIAKEGHMLANALSATELVLANEQHLTNLDGLATAAAHELGTPLSTIQLVAKELERDLSPDDPLHEDMVLLRTQAERCRDILGKLRSLSGDEHNNFTKMRITSLICEIVEPFETMGVEIEQVFPDDLARQPVVWRNPGILFGLGNLIENAVEFAHSRVEVTAHWGESNVLIRISDDGPGFSEEIMKHLGDPFVTTRSNRTRTARAALANPATKGHSGASFSGGGLGLGFFIAKTLLERTGGKVSIANRNGSKTALQSNNTFENSGAMIDILWPRSALETDQ